MERDMTAGIAELIGRSSAALIASDVSLDYEEQEFIIICTERICDNR